MRSLWRPRALSCASVLRFLRSLRHRRVNCSAAKIVIHLADVREAYQDLARRHTRGKIVLVP